MPTGIGENRTVPAAFRHLIILLPTVGPLRLGKEEEKRSQPDF